ncbi:MAG: glycosyltransferase family 4 protein [Desulfofustis sp.]|nr:glycosyltransferase family 4 protein [Desulfofustis sp.]
MARILRKHKTFFSPEEARVAMDGARNRLMVSIISSRSPFSGAGKRLHDWCTFARAGWRHAEFQQQTAYCFSPRHFFRRQEKAANVFFLFRDTPSRRNTVQRVIAGDNRTFERGQLFGFADFLNEGIAVDCNLRLPRTHSLRETLAGLRERRYVSRVGIGLGDVCSTRAHLWQMNRARVVVATTDNTGLPAARLKASGKLRSTLVYISVGLPERLKAVEANNRARAGRYRKLLSSVDRFIAYGHAEAEWLRQWLGDDADVRFFPFGVDTERWVPQDVRSAGFDVLSIGADFMRDFDLLVEYANSRPEVSICVVTRRGCLTDHEILPENVQVKYDIETDELKKLISAAKVIALPVKENTYSGATTTLLQCMAMEKPVAVSRVGAIREGYGFSDGENLRWLTPGSLESMAEVLNELLANPSLCKKIGAEARRHVRENLNWDRFVDNLRECLKEWLWKKMM